MVQQLRAVTRGRMRQVAGPGGRAVEAALYGCQVVRAPHDKSGKTYMTLDIGSCVGDLDVLRQVDDFVKKHAAPNFSPLLPGGHLVVKVPAGVKYENAAGNPAAHWPVLTNSVIDVVLRPGAFGDFGYCWLVQRLKPAAV